MAYLALFRKYRPQTFEEMVGQEAVAVTLQNAVRAGRIAQAYLFAGPRGVGKTTAARILAKCLNCQEGPTPTPCNRCESCQRIAQGSALDIVEIDAASNRGIDDIRNLRESVRYAPAQGRYKFYILDEAHQITADAFNALLKTLEEPPPHVVFVLATTEPHRVPPTILSRCQRFDFRRVPVAAIVEHLQRVAQAEGFHLEPEAAFHIARVVEGSLRDALSILDQLVAYSGGRITTKEVEEVLGLLESSALLEFADALAQGDVPRLLAWVERWLDRGKEPHHLLNELLQHFRTLLLVQMAPGHPEVAGMEEAHRAALQEQSQRFPPQRLLGILERLAQTDRELRWASQPRWALEMMVAELVLSLAPPASPPGAERPPAPEEPSTAPLPSLAEVNLEALRQLWGDLLQRVRQEKMATWTLIRRTVPWRVEGSTLVVAMEPSAPFALESANEPRHRGVVEQLLNQCTQGAITTVRYEPCQDLQHLSPPSRRPLGVEDILEIFPGSYLVEGKE